MSHTWVPAEFAGDIGVARRDITPPPGIFVRNWGPTTQTAADGIHRPLSLTALAAVPRGGDAPLILITADLPGWHSEVGESLVRDGTLMALSLPPSNLILHCTHTHAGPTLTDDCVGQAGGELTPLYMQHLRDAAVDAACAAVRDATPAVIQWSAGRCDLASNRDLPVDSRYVVGFNPTIRADDTVIVARVTDANRRTIATLVNYACHPTTLAWQNRKVSPDFVGAMRDVVESAHDAPCLFLQGASAELAPRVQYTGDLELADKHGRQLGYAALSVLEGMLPPGEMLALRDIVESGAALGMWGLVPNASPTSTNACIVEVPLALKELPTAEELRQRWAGINAVSLAERLRRAEVIRNFYNKMGDSTATYQVWVWQLGLGVFVGVPGEAGSLLQTTLRERYPELQIIVMNLANDLHATYLPDLQAYEHDAYQAWQSVFAPGSLEKVIETVGEHIAGVLQAEPERRRADE